MSRPAPAMLAWDPARLHWALLDPRALGRARIRPAECGYLFEDLLPCPIEEVQAAYAWLPDGRVVACGAERAALAEAAASGAMSLVPASLPGWMPADVRAEADPAALELLAGDLEPVSVARGRRAFAASLGAIAVAGGAILLWGIVARGRALAAAAAAVEARRAEIVQAATAGLGGAGGVGAVGGGGRLPPELRLAAELRELERTRAVAVPAPADAACVLAAVLARWPEGAELRPESVAADARSVAVRGRARDAAEMQRLADALGSLPGWRLAAPEFRSARDGVDFTISLSVAPAAGAAGAGPRGGGG